MGRLSDFSAYLGDRLRILEEIEGRLSALQAKYEIHFQEVAKVRESELARISDTITRNRGTIPPEFARSLDEAQAVVEKEFDAQLSSLVAKHAKSAGLTEDKRQESIAAERDIRAKNVDLDRQEEDLKTRNEELLRRIADYNRRIGELAGGFGFFKNLFAMRRLARERHAIDDEQAVVAARIERVRAEWAHREADYSKKEILLSAAWRDLKTRAAQTQAQIDYLKDARPRIVFRSTLERVLFARVSPFAPPGPGDVRCPRCKAPNPPAHHFCHLCATRLSPERPDLEGTLEEVAEINGHFDRFSQGMKVCQEIIGLVTGLTSGMRALGRSVATMIANEDKFPLPKLQISVPPESVKFGENFDALDRAVGQDLSLHPKEFGDQVHRVLKDVFTEARIKSYFEWMGDELSLQATSQWHS